MADMGKSRAHTKQSGKREGAENPREPSTALATLVVLRNEVEPADKTDTARYIAEMSAELSALAGGAKYDLLAYFLSMAQVEADAIVRRGGLAPD